MIRTTVILGAVLLLLTSCGKKEQFTISGTVADTTQTTIYLQQRVDGNWKVIDSTTLVNGKFQFTGKVEVPEEYYLSKSERDKLMLFIENCPITVTTYSVLIGKANVKGGTVQELYNVYMVEFYKQNDAMSALETQWEGEQRVDVKKKLEVQLDSLDKSFTGFQEKFMLDHYSSPVAPYLLSLLQYGKNSEELSALLAKLDPSLANTISYKSLQKRIDALKRVALGQKAPDFTQIDADGNSITFSSVYGKNKYTLVDFWASWCGPCRAENPNVVAAFQQFNGKGFGVFGVSLDSNKERWLKAIADDKLTWQHVSDLKGWGNEAAKEYAVNSIPSNFLVDQNGIILSANLRGEELIKKLTELLK
jgi:peroxiredoxin